MVKIELEAAEALAGLAKTASRGSESNDRNSSSANSYKVATNLMAKKRENPGVSTAKSVKDEHNTDLRLNPVFPTNSVTSGRKSRQNLTEAEIEARKIRRVLANRESARQTIRRRQAVFEELTRKAVDLSWENENLKKEKETVSKHFDSLKAKNECLKTQMKVMTNEAKETREECITTNEPSISASSTNSPFYNCVQPSFVPLVWPNSVQLQCGPPARIVLPSHIPISPSHTSKPVSSSCEASSMAVNGSVNGLGSGTPLYLLPYPWLFTLPQNNNENHHHRVNSFNLNDKPKESCECQQLFPVSDGFPPDGGARPTTNLVSCEELLIEHDDTNKVGDSKQVVGEIHKVPVVCSGKRLGNMVAAAEARRRRKQVTRLKNHAHCRQLRTH
ncbi:uncharacterized protein LOC143582271 [Bidens hawaiensis]|uniref:uncharacterized protein LOC143582271 n=1 Tax=Bidens hawaiensis TaxID=980011 RepID=UPI00404A0E7A